MSLKRIGTLLMILVLSFALIACGNNNDSANDSSNGESETPEVVEDNGSEEAEKPEDSGSDFDASTDIAVVSREDGSGTRGAFVEITGVQVKENDEKVDKTTVEAIIQNSTNGVMTTVAGNEFAIGYISLGSLNETVKAVQVEGVEADAELVKSGDYTLARPFNLAWKEDNIGEIGQDLLDYIKSAEGQAIIEDNGFVAAIDGEDYEAKGLSGHITVAGSTSVTPVMEKLVEAYGVLNPDVQIDIQSTGSSSGMKSAMDGSANIGMASRELKDEEAAELEQVAIAIDGIAVIVHNDNPIENLTMDEIRQIFIGEITTWSDVIK